MNGPGSSQLRAYLRMRQAGTPLDAAAAMAGLSPSEARLTDTDEAKGLLAHIDLSEDRSGSDADARHRRRVRRGCVTPIRFTVPGVPVAKGRPRISVRGGHARAYTPARTVAYEGLAALAAQEAMAGRPPLDGPVRIEVVAWFAVPASWSKRKRRDALEGRLHHVSRPDGDNILKALGDGLNGVCWRDDSQISQASVAKAYAEKPGVDVIIEALS